jgi:hypothetical protein
MSSYVEMLKNQDERVVTLPYAVLYNAVENLEMTYLGTGDHEILQLIEYLRDSLSKPKYQHTESNVVRINGSKF